MTPEERGELEVILGHHFQRPEELDRALTHRSHRQSSQGTDNERLEFLGDRVLGLVASEHLCRSFPDWDSGQLSKGLARVVSATSLHAAAKKLKLGHFLRLGPGEEKTGGRDKPALLADAFEAIVAAMYLDGGLRPARDLLKRTVFEQALEDGDRISESDRKSALQEFLQAKGDQPAEYRLAGETGPDHQKTFRVEVWVKGAMMSSAEGTTKKEAEQKAARSALDKLLSADASQREEVGPNAG